MVNVKYFLSPEYQRKLGKWRNSYRDDMGEGQVAKIIPDKRDKLKDFIDEETIRPKYNHGRQGNTSGIIMGENGALCEILQNTAGLSSGGLNPDDGPYFRFFKIRISPSNNGDIPAELSDLFSSNGYREVPEDEKIKSSGIVGGSSEIKNFF